MNFLKRLTSFFSAPSGASSRFYKYSVQCNRCGEVIHGQVDLFNDLSVDYGVGEEGDAGGSSSGEQGDTYFCRKVLIGENRCYQPVEVELTFVKDKRSYRLVDHKIKGGKFLEEGE